MSRTGRWLIFLYLYQGVPNNDVTGIPQNTCSSTILFSIGSVIYYFRIQTTLPSLTGVLGIIISNLGGGELTSQSQIIVIVYTPSNQTEVRQVSSKVQCFCLGCMLIPCYMISFKHWFGPSWPKFVFWLESNCILKDFNPGGDIVYIKGIPITSLLGKPLGTGDYDFYTHWYWLCNINSPLIFTQNCHGKRIIIPRCECYIHAITV